MASLFNKDNSLINRGGINSTFRVVGASFSVLLVMAFATILAYSLYMHTFWPSYFYGDLPGYNQFCSYRAMLSDSRSIPDGIEENLRPMTPPYWGRKLLGDSIPNSKHGHIYYKCDIPTSEISKVSEKRMIHISYFVGDFSSFYVNGEERYNLIGTNTTVDVPILERDLLGEVLKFEMFVYTKTKSRAGFQSKVPLTITGSSDDSERLLGLSFLFDDPSSLLQSLPPLALSLSMVLAWLFGAQSRLTFLALFFFGCVAIRGIVESFSDILSLGSLVAVAGAERQIVIAFLVSCLFGLELVGLSKSFLNRSIYGLMIVCAASVGVLLFYPDSDSFFSNIYFEHCVAYFVVSFAGGIVTLGICLNQLIRKRVKPHDRLLGRVFVVGLAVSLLMLGHDAYSFGSGIALFPNFDMLMSLLISSSILYSLASSQEQMLYERDARNKAEFDLAEKQDAAAMGELTQFIAHDIRKPLTSSKILLKMIRQEKDPINIKKMAQDFLPSLEQSYKHADTMIRDILDINRKSRLYLEPVSPESLIDTSLQSVFGSSSPSVDIKFQYSFSHSYKAQADGTRLVRAISNLVENAAQAMPEGGVISFLTREVDSSKGEVLEISVRNTGSYISPEDLSKIFDLYHTRGKKGGSGLGLPIVQRIIEQHEGSISCSSDKEEGTVFSIRIPSAKPEASNSTVNLPDSVHKINRENRADEDELAAGIAVDQLKPYHRTYSKKFRIAVLDDEIIYLRTFAQLLASNIEVYNSCRLDVFEHPRDLLGIDYEHFDLVICDFNLGSPTLNGIEVIAKIRALGYAGLAGIASNLPGEVDEEISRGDLDFYLAKPIGWSKLGELITRAIQRKAAIVAAES